MGRLNKLSRVSQNRAAVQSSLGTEPSDPNDPGINQPCDPDVYSPDPRLVCAVQREHSIRWQSATIDNARKGDLVLSPADGLVIEGALPPQT